MRSIGMQVSTRILRRPFCLIGDVYTAVKKQAGSLGFDISKPFKVIEIKQWDDDVRTFLFIHNKEEVNGKN